MYNIGELTLLESIVAILRFWRVKYVANTSHTRDTLVIIRVHSHKTSSYSPYAVAASASTSVTMNTCNEKEQGFNNHDIYRFLRERLFDIKLRVVRSRSVEISLLRTFISEVFDAYDRACWLFYSSCLSSVGTPALPPLLPSTLYSSSRSRNPSFVPTTVTTAIAITVK